MIFANAGGGTLGAFGEVTEADFDRTVATNLKGTFFTVQSLLPLIPDGGSIILNGSIAASRGLPAFTVYSATKAAIRSFARTWTTDLGPRRIRVNTLAPGTIVTPIMSEQAGFSDAEVEGFTPSSRRRRRSAATASRMRSHRSPCSSPLTIAVLSPASSCTSTAASPQV